MAIALFFLDQVFKYLIRQLPELEPLVAFGPFQIVHFENTAGPFSLPLPFLLLLSLHAIILGGALWWSIRAPQYQKGLAFILSGGFSNFVDRVVFRSTTDYFGLPFGGYWNLADIAVISGIFLIVFTKHPQQES